MRDERGASSIPALAVLVLLGVVAAVGIFGNKDRHKTVDLATLTASTTATTIPTAPVDAQPFSGTGGLVVHPRAEAALFSSPGADDAFGKIGPTQFGPTWLPVVDQTDG